MAANLCRGRALISCNPLITPSQRFFQRSTTGSKSAGFPQRSSLKRSSIRVAAGADGLIEKVTDLVRPGFVPRPVAKAIIVFWGAGFVWSVVQKLFSFVIVLGALGGGAYFFFKPKNKGEEVDKRQGGDGESNPLASAKRIMDKYK